jgi:hypothetical protein
MTECGLERHARAMTWQQTAACDIMITLNVDSVETAITWPDDNQDIELPQSRASGGQLKQ